MILLTASTDEGAFPPATGVDLGSVYIVRTTAWGGCFLWQSYGWEMGGGLKLRIEFAF
jgi:hypothetical protein